MKICQFPSIKSCKQCSHYEVRKNLLALARARECIDAFIAPSHTVYDFFLQNGVNPAKMHYQKYGFNKESIQYIKRTFHKDSPVRFAFMGRIIPTKGIRILIEAFEKMCGYTTNGSQLFGKKYTQSYIETKLFKALSDKNILQ